MGFGGFHFPHSAGENKGAPPPASLRADRPPCSGKGPAPLVFTCGMEKDGKVNPTSCWQTAGAPCFYLRNGKSAVPHFSPICSGKTRGAGTAQPTLGDPNHVHWELKNADAAAHGTGSGSAPLKESQGAAPGGARALSGDVAFRIFSIFPPGRRPLVFPCGMGKVGPADAHSGLATQPLEFQARKKRRRR